SFPISCLLYYDVAPHCYHSAAKSNFGGVTKRSLRQTHISHASGSGVDEGIGIIPVVPGIPAYESDDEEISWKSSKDDDDDDEEKISEHDNDVDDQSDDDDQDDNEDEQTDSDNDGDDFVYPKFSTHDEEDKDEESFDPIVQTPSQVENTDDEDSHGMNVEGDEGANEEDEANELYRDVNINIAGQDVQMIDVQTTQVIEETHVTLTSINLEGQQQSSYVSSCFVSNMLKPSPDTGIDFVFKSTPRVDVPVMTTVELPLLSATTLPPPSIPIILHVRQTPAPSTTNVPSSSLQDLPNFGSLSWFDHRLKTLETNFLEFMQTNQFAEVISSNPGIIDKYLDHRMNEAVKVAVRLQSDRLRDEAQAENEDFINKLDENSQKIIKEQVKEQVKTSYVVATDLSKLELKKILIDKMESNKSIHRSDEQNNLYKALVDAYECDKLILDTYGYTVTLKRRQDNEDKDEEPSAGSNRGSKRRRAGKEPESTSAPKKKTSKTSGKSTEGSKSHHKTASESAHAKEPMHTTHDLEEPVHQEFETGATDDQPVEEASQHPHYNLAKKADSRTSFNELMDTPVDFSAFVMNRLKVDTLTPKLLACPTYELMKGSCKSLVELEFFLEEVVTLYLSITSSTATLSIYVVVPQAESIQLQLQRLRQQIMNTLNGLKIWESARDVYSKRRIIDVTELQIFEWHNYKHLDWITVRRDDDKLYKFKEGDFKRLGIQDIEDMLLLLVQGKLTNLTVDERFAFNVSLRMFARSIVIQRCVKDLQLGVKSYQKKLNLTKPDSYRSDLKHKEAYTDYSKPRGFIYQNKDKHNRLMRIDELHKFSDGTLNDVRTALDDRLKGIRMQYLPQTIWRRSDKDRAGAMIQAIDKQLKTRRIMRSLEKFDCDGIPTRPTMYLNLWSYKAVRNRYSNPMIQREPKGSTQGYALVSVEVLSDEVLKLKNFKKDSLLKLFKLSKQDRYEHVGPKSQVHNVYPSMVTMVVVSVVGGCYRSSGRDGVETTIVVGRNWGGGLGCLGGVDGWPKSGRRWLE
nr:hypothetical protein [Tanacetum cinerariifolium]